MRYYFCDKRLFKHYDLACKQLSSVCWSHNIPRLFVAFSIEGEVCEVHHIKVGNEAAISLVYADLLLRLIPVT